MTHYETLGIPEDATTDEIKAAYRILIRRSHPDIIGEEGIAKSALINAAYTVIGDPDSRTLYNASLRSERRQTSFDYSTTSSEVWDDHEAPTNDQWSEPEPEDEPLRFIDFWDHPITRRKIIAGAFGFALFVAATVVALFMMSVEASQIATASLLLSAITTIMWRPPVMLRVITALSLFAPMISPHETDIKIVFVFLMIAALPLLRYGTLALRSVLSQISEDRSARARVRREREARIRADRAAQKKADREAEYQRAAAERRAARQAKKRK